MPRSQLSGLSLTPEAALRKSSRTLKYMNTEVEHS